MWPFRNDSIVTLGELEAALISRGVQQSFTQIKDARQRAEQFDRYSEVKEKFYRLHLRSLSKDEQRAFRDGTHPSQSHDRFRMAEPMTTQLQSHLSNIGVKSNVCLGTYHMERIVLSVDLANEPTALRGQLPWLFHGYEVKYGWPENDVATDPPFGIESS